MLVHADRHLPCAQRPHTRCHSHITRSVTHPCLIHTYYTTHTHGGTHPRCFNHTGGFAHRCRFPRARGFFPLRCPFNTRRAGKHARRHTVTTLLTHGGSFVRGVSLGVAHGVALGVSLIHGDASTHGDALGVSHGVSFKHGVSFGVALTHALLLVLCVRRSTHLNTLVYMHRDTTHTGTTLFTTHTGTTLTHTHTHPHTHTFLYLDH